MKPYGNQQNWWFRRGVRIKSYGNRTNTIENLQETQQEKQRQAINQPRGRWKPYEKYFKQEGRNQNTYLTPEHKRKPYENTRSGKPEPKDKMY